FSKMASGALTREPINIDDRLISVVQRSTTMVWFHFHEICHMPRSQQDYVYLAEQFHTVMISDIPAIQADQDNSITYFIHLVDVFYDA
ncbi:AFG1/ZapE family ATPase, partial [Acinetobacter baumannii]